LIFRILSVFIRVHPWFEFSIISSGEAVDQGSRYYARKVSENHQNPAMFSSKQLTAEQIAEIKVWADAGAQLPDIQRRIREEMNHPVTYMDTRFLILDLEIELHVEKEPEPAVEDIAAPEITSDGTTHVTMDALPLPGTLASGKVTFSDGELGVWGIDQTGRPTVDFSTDGYQPSREDIMEFQVKLRALIEQSGL
jgi:hypothetical protein